MKTFYFPRGVLFAAIALLLVVLFVGGVAVASSGQNTNGTQSGTQNQVPVVTQTITPTNTTTAIPTSTPLPPTGEPSATPTATNTPTPQGWDWAEPNNEFGSGSVVAVQTTAQGLTLAPAGDVDFFRTFVKAGQIVNFTTFVQAGDTKMKLYTEGGSLIAENDDKSDRDLGSSILYVVAGDQWLVVQVESAVPNFTGAYDLSVLLESPTPTPTSPPPGPTSIPVPTETPVPPPVEDDQHEPNNGFDNATEIVSGSTYDATLPDGDIDFYRLLAKGGNQYSCNTAGLSGVDTIMTVYSSSRSPLAGNDDHSPTDVSSQVTWQAESENFVFIEVRAVAGRGTYSLYCSALEPTATPAPPTGGGGYTPPPTVTPSMTPTPTPTRIVLGLRLSHIVEPTIEPVVETNIAIRVSYDANDNRIPDIAEGIPNISIRAVSGGQIVGWALTDERGEALISVVGAVERVVIPYLSSWEATVRPGQSLDLNVQIPAIPVPVIAPIATEVPEE